MDKFKELNKQLKLLAKYASALALLGWDEEVNLPPSGHAFRGEVNALLSSDLHKKVTSPELIGLVDELSAADNFSKLTPDQQVVVRETKRDIDHAKKFPPEFVERMALLTSKAFGIWVEARKKSDFKLYQPVLEEIVELKKQEAELIGYEGSLYDALLDEYELGMTTAKVDALFEPLAKQLADLILPLNLETMPKLPDFKYDVEKQKRLNQEIAQALGYDIQSGLISISPHPFTISMHSSDVRVTTRYDENDFWVAIGSTIHEVGHALYEQGLPETEWGTPLGEAVSLGIHESQSRSWENFVGRSRSFTDFLYPKIESYFGKLPYTPEQLYLWLNKVKPVSIRVESDEVTYNLHIILRYELEKDLIEGRLNVADLPAAWNDKVKKYLGLEIKNDAEGVLQDVHWSHASFGYFPTYTLGNLYAAQLFESAKKATPNLEAGFAKGEFKPLLDWFSKNIHEQGRRYHPDELIQRATGQKPDSSYLIDHLKSKTKLHS